MIATSCPFEYWVGFPVPQKKALFGRIPPRARGHTHLLITKINAMIDIMIPAAKRGRKKVTIILANQLDQSHFKTTQEESTH